MDAQVASRYLSRREVQVGLLESIDVDVSMLVTWNGTKKNCSPLRQ